ncbi:hypothetical protein ABPG75_006610 [Micractinium tetrahymenae]
MSAAPGDPATAETRALFDALLTGKTDVALALLQGPGAAQLAHAGPAGFSSLHAAVVGRLKDVGAASQLLELGATPTPALGGLPCPFAGKNGRIPPRTQQLLTLLLQHGANCLSVAPNSWSFGPRPQSFLRRYEQTGLASHLLAYLEAQRTAGTLRLGGVAEARELVQVAQLARHCTLLAHALHSWGRRLAAEPAAGQLAPEDAALLGQLLRYALELPAAKAIPLVRAMLASGLPLLACTPAPERARLLARAALHSNAVRRALPPLLHAAGCPLTMETLLLAIRELAPVALAALLALGRPAVDSRPLHHDYSCPIHALLRRIVSRSQSVPGPCAGTRGAWERRQAIRVLETLLAAGYRPTVYRDQALPSFLLRGSTRVLPAFDPFDFHHLDSLDERLVFLARGGTWTPATHHLWPDAFKAAARILLLAASSAGVKPAAEAAPGGSSSKRRRRGRGAAKARPRFQHGWLAALPAGAVMHILKLSALPMSAWL